MNENDLTLFVGRKIKHYRKKKEMTQKELGEKIGVKHNTIATYESGRNAPEQNAIFKIAKALNVTVDDFFPSINTKDNYLNRLEELGSKELNINDMQFLNELIKKTLSMDDEERGKFLESIRFTVEYYEKH